MPAKPSIVGARSIAASSRSSTLPGLKCFGRGKVLRPANDQRHQQPAVVTKLFAAHVRLAVVTEENDDGVVRESVGFQLFEDEPDLAVQLRR